MSAMVALSPTFTIFIVSRFFLGLSLGGVIVMSFVLGGEQAFGSWRPAISILHQVPFGIGQVLLSVLAYFLRDWRDLQMALSVVSLMFLPYCWLIEESPQWLVAAGRSKAAERVEAAIRRRNQITEARVTEMCLMATDNRAEIVKTDNTQMKNGRVGDKVEAGLCSMFRDGRLCRYSLSIWLMWFNAGLAFFTLNAYQTSLGGDPYLNVGVGGLVGGIPGNILTVFLVKHYGRKKIIILAHLLTALLAILIPIYDTDEAPWDWQRRVAGLLTLAGMSIAYPSMFLASGEMLPAVVRAPVMAVANLMARLGNAMAPLVIPTAKVHRWAPLWVVSAAPLISALVMVTLPETHHRPLPIHIQDIHSASWKEDTEILKTEENGMIYEPKGDIDV